MMVMTDGPIDRRRALGTGIGRLSLAAVAAAAGESWVTVGETLPEDGWRGDTLLARVRWGRPNRLATVAVADRR